MTKEIELTVPLNTETNSDNKSDTAEEGKEVKSKDDTSTDNTKDAGAEGDNDFTNTVEFKNAVNKATEERIHARIARSEQKSSKLTEELDTAREELATMKVKWDELETERSKATYENTLWKVANEQNVSFDVVSSLRGDTYDELTESVKRVKASSTITVDRIFDGKPKGGSTVSIADSIIEKYK